MDIIDKMRNVLIKIGIHEEQLNFIDKIIDSGCLIGLHLYTPLLIDRELYVSLKGDVMDKDKFLKMMDGTMTPYWPREPDHDGNMLQLSYLVAQENGKDYMIDLYIKESVDFCTW